MNTSTKTVQERANDLVEFIGSAPESRYPYEDRLNLIWDNNNDPVWAVFQEHQTIFNFLGVGVQIEPIYAELNNENYHSMLAKGQNMMKSLLAKQKKTQDKQIIKEGLIQQIGLPTKTEVVNGIETLMWSTPFGFCIATFDDRKIMYAISGGSAKQIVSRIDDQNYEVLNRQGIRMINSFIQSKTGHING